MAATKRVAKRVRPKPPAKSKAPATKSDATKSPATKKKAPAKKTTAKAPAKSKDAAKTAPKKTAAKKTTTTSATSARKGPVREVNEHGFVPGTDSAKIADILLAGGADRNDVNAKVEKAIGTETRNGTKKNVPALVSGVLNRLIENGYKVESSWVLTAPAKKASKTKKKVAKKK